MTKRSYKPGDPWYIDEESDPPWIAAEKHPEWTPEMALWRCNAVLDKGVWGRDRAEVAHWYIEFHNELVRRRR